MASGGTWTSRQAGKAWDNTGGRVVAAIGNVCIDSGRDDQCSTYVERHPEVAQAIVNTAGGVLDMNPMTAWLPLDLEGHGVNTKSGWYRAGQIGMAIPDIVGGVKALASLPELISALPQALKAGRTFLESRAEAFALRGGGRELAENLADDALHLVDEAATAAPQGVRRFGPGAAHIDDPALGGAGKWMSPDEFADDVIRDTRNQYRSLPTETGQHGAGLRAAARDLREQARTAGYLPEIRDRLLRKAEEWEARARGIDHPGRR